MARNVLLIVAGAIAGGAAVYWLAGGDPADGEAGSAGTASSLASGVDSQSTGIGSPAAGDPGAAVSAAGASATGLVAARIEAYERALEATDAVDLESAIGLALAQPRSRVRDLDIAARLARLAELDPRRAVEFARTAFLDTPFLIQAFTALARVDDEAAVAELAGVTPAAKQRRVALALLGLIGHDRGVALVASGLPEEVRASFELDALVARAETDPAGAMAAALELDSGALRNSVLPRLAAAAVARDPRLALALGDSIDDHNSRLAYRLAALNAWAEIDPEAVFAFLEANELRSLEVNAGGTLTMNAGGMFATLARHDAERLLATVDGLPLAVRATARQAVARSLAESDPEAALAMLDRMAPGRDREQLLSTIAQAYGRRDPDLALAWAESLSPPSRSALEGVLRGAVAVDPNRVFDLLIDQLDGRAPAPGGPALLSAMPIMAIQLLSSSDIDRGRLADALLERSEPQAQLLVSAAVATWALRDSDAALSWTLANADVLDPTVLRGVAERVANDDLDLALGMLPRIPAPQRPGWIEGVISQMARTDIARAQSFLSQLRGQTGYDEAYGVVVRAMARTDPPGAARMLSDAPPSTNAPQASFTIAREWANRDPAAAARWALSLADAETQRTAVSNIASVWAQRNAADAERWLFGLAIGPARDAAADGYVEAAAQAGRFEPRVLEAYGSERARQESASRAIVTIGASDPARAAQLLEQHVTDSAIRARAEQQLARRASPAGRVFVSEGNVIFSQ